MEAVKLLLVVIWRACWISNWSYSVTFQPYK